MTLLVQLLVVCTRLSSVFPRRDDRDGFALGDECNELGAVLSFVSNDVLAVEVSQQGLGLGNVMAMATCQQNMKRIAQAIYQDVDFGAEPTSAAAQRLRFRPTVFWAAPAAHGWARTMVLSGITLSISASSLK